MRRAGVTWFGVMAVLALVPSASAEHPGKGRGTRHEESVEESARKAGKRVTKEAIDAVADELTGTPAGGSKGMPPGLAKKGKMPPGLEKQGKTPPGWEKGKKAGWGKEPGQESLIRRVVRGIFGRGKPQPPSQAPPQ